MAHCSAYTVVSIMHRELSVTFGHTKLPVPKSLSHFLPQLLLPTINFIAYMSFDEQLCQEEMEKNQHARVKLPLVLFRVDG